MFDNSISYRMKDMMRILFGAAAVFVFFSLISFDVNDIHWLTTHGNEPLKNYTGLVGAYMIFGLRFLFGSAVWLVPFLFCCWTINGTHVKSFSEFGKELLGTFFALVSLASLLSLGGDSLSDFLYKGGLVGPQVAGLFLISLNTFGSIFILSIILFLSLAVATEFFVLSLFSFAMRQSTVALKHAWKLGGVVRSSVANSERVAALKRPRAAENKKNRDDDEEATEPVNEVEELEPVVKPWIRPAKPQKVKIAKRKIKNDEESGQSELPPVDLLEACEDNEGAKRAENIEETSRILSATLKNFDIAAEVVAVNQGPVITVYEVQPAPGVKINRIVNLSNDIALALSAPSVRIVAPIPGKAVIGVEIPNKFPEKVFFRDLIESSEFQDAESKLSLALGKDVAGDPLIAKLDSMPHLLIAGSTGSGKTVCINALVMSLLFKSTPDEVRMIMVDPKMVEMTFYNDIPHLLTPVITDARKASDALMWAVSEMERRYELFSEVGVRNIAGYHKRFESSQVKTYQTKKGEEKRLEKVPYIVVIIDELADLMMTSAQDVETSICRLAQLSRAVGIHLIIATQRPSVNVITGLIKSNLPCRISFKVASAIDSRTILDSKGGETLIGSGDMLFIPPGLSAMVRAQGCYLTDDEIRAVVDFLKKQKSPEYIDIFTSAKVAAMDEEVDELYDEAVRIVIESGQASASFLQRRMRIGYNRASRLIDMMEQNGVISAARGSKPRDVLINSYEPSSEEYEYEYET